MSFTGTLDDFSPVEIISVLDILEKSGKLHLNRGEEEGLVVFRRGKIIFAASSGFRENLGTMLLARGLVNEDQLVEALGKQVTSSEEKRLGTILIEMGALTQEAQNSVILEQVIRTVSEFANWDSGNFVFSSVHVADHGEVELPSGELWVPLGLSPNHVLLRLAQKSDETSHEASTAPAEMEPQEESVSEATDAIEVPELDIPEGEESTSLKTFVGELRGPQVKGELIQRLLEQAGEAFGRCLLFSVRQDGFRTIAQAGQALPKPADGTPMLEVTLDRDLPSILNQCASSGHTVTARMPQEAGDYAIVEALGGPVNEESVAMPLAVKNDTVLILYGDKLHDPQDATWRDNLEGFIAEAAHVIEADIQAEIAAEIAAATSA
jgi:hypothetical protein